MIDFGTEVRAALKAQGKSLRGAARELHYDVAYLSRVINGKQPPSSEIIRAVNEYLGLSLTVEDAGGPQDDEMDAWELARRVQASDVGNATLERLELTFDSLAMAYPKSNPADLLRQVRKHSGYVVKLLDGRKTLSEHRRLLILGGWLSLLGATVHIDLMQDDAATARLETAATLAREAGFPDIEAWCYETEAWRVLTDGEYVQAVDLSRAAQEIAPSGTSALIQATAQEGRAHARLGNAAETYAAIERVQEMSASLGTPDTPEHHYRYDPGKSLSYVATTLAWLGDSAAEPYAREIIKQLSPSDDVTMWPRRVASANIDLALVLLKGNRLDEACGSAQSAILSGRVVPSNHWRALEVVKAVEARQLPESADLREAYQGLKAIER
ncbi:helix-turn-helix domain-containing protein [Streptomyces sp. GQFP]|uniref:helix-turn-helix domain-containing protein n=1 Tax=Streptomyces sp. GQFP TaxID=2907545 RepID=UPI001F1E5C01|nr:helix-turn-helix transcriptional regulator [Streptomyces sp. GQFP]UIX31256.1 helix-turn-helix domain-containing protein [Streptomyces sp. GQFP]